MNTQREAQIRELLAKNPKVWEEAQNRLLNALNQTAADLYIDLFPSNTDDDECMDVIEKILIESLWQ